MGKESSGVIKRILKDHFDGFWKMHSGVFPASYREDIKETVEKAIKCGTADLGYARYECLGCEGGPKPLFVCFTCKSRFCHKCGKKYTDDWSDKQQEMIFNVPHCHMVFTIPKELRNVFFQDRKKLSLLLESKKKKKTYRQRMIEAFDKDPFICPHCHREMDLVEIWHADYGFLYHYMEDMESIKSIRRNNLEQKQGTG